jgi:endonuclease/exonuclease/phosphatase family metal-dependent hydrolase
LIVRAEIDRPDGAFVVYGARVEDALGSALEPSLDLEVLQQAALDEELPFVIAGGLGASDRSTAYRQLDATFRDALRAGTRAQNTLLGLLWRPVMLRFDYVFTSHAWCAADGTTIPVTGIDHAAVAASVGACPKA